MADWNPESYLKFKKERTRPSIFRHSLAYLIGFFHVENSLFSPYAVARKHNRVVSRNRLKTVPFTA